ncbi:heme o synthase [Leptospira licerasiae]|uniref:Protoheme IX farnesyltransferase n=1 Tax=Leptospira licerasiae str. MMD4847 TaxID=1049971 RepID=A0ABN0H5T6_9LEPT|nr:heme o synthase [Leptospira licerasiae]EIE02668.1 protoheme IX farnesyltransferase [Leptospira licerasiae serovar Varillal str. VAR 010]EJZ40760.1 protoheme IX farnesyltransferase [Leptospira licerasiae str. MMD4847]TGM90385.1 protoheme IX farnesyltransferase [Leptospira licerasiae]
MNSFLSDWNQMIKPRVSSLVLATAVPGLYLGGSSAPSTLLVFMTMLGTFLMSSASFVFNQIIEIDRDSKMKRTANRPLPAGRISVAQAWIAGFAMTFAAFWILYYFANLLTAICAFAALLAYVFLYTILLKPRTHQNIVIGGVAGCVGPLIGYAAVSNSLPLPAWILFLMIFLWTPAHFWALAIFLKEDYSDANFPMLPVVKGVKETGRSILFYTILYVGSVIAFYWAEPSMGWLYMISSVALSISILYLSVKLFQNPEPKFARGFFFFSILHLFLINILILIDHSIAA